jgi:hypothetical protein
MISALNIAAIDVLASYHNVYGEVTIYFYR